MTQQSTATTSAQQKSRQRRSLRDIASRLYHGEAGVDVVGKRKIFYGVAAGILLLAVITPFVRQFNIGIEFRGGNSFNIPASVGTLEEVRAAVEDAGAEVASAQEVGGEGGSYYLVKTVLLDEDASTAANRALEVKQSVADRFGIPTEDISEDSVSGTWGASVTRQAIIGTVVFLILVVIYLSIVFREWKMAVAALAALFQNLILTATVYLLVGFEVTPATVIGFLTILGFALYDVVVVFDKVRENTRGITGNPNRTYGEAANLAVNQTLMRSINTGVVALLPVGGLLFIGAGILGAGTLKDLGLVLFIGMLAAVYSSIFLATPVLVDLKEAEPKFKVHKQRVLQRRAGLVAERKATPAGKVRPSAPGVGGSAGRAPARPAAAKASGRTVREAEVEDVQTPTTRPKAGDDGELLAGAAPRPGARPAPRKRTGGGGGGGGKTGGRPGGSRGGGRKR